MKINSPQSRVVQCVYNPLSEFLLLFLSSSHPLGFVLGIAAQMQMAGSCFFLSGELVFKWRTHSLVVVFDAMVSKTLVHGVKEKINRQKCSSLIFRNESFAALVTGGIIGNYIRIRNFAQQRPRVISLVVLPLAQCFGDAISGHNSKSETANFQNFVVLFDWNAHAFQNSASARAVARPSVYNFPPAVNARWIINKTGQYFRRQRGIVSPISTHTVPQMAAQYSFAVVIALGYYNAHSPRQSTFGQDASLTSFAPRNVCCKFGFAFWANDVSVIPPIHTVVAIAVKSLTNNPTRPVTRGNVFTAMSAFANLNAAVIVVDLAVKLYAAHKTAIRAVKARVSRPRSFEVFQSLLILQSNEVVKQVTHKFRFFTFRVPLGRLFVLNTINLPYSHVLSTQNFQLF
jgi:hypothetical protein